jgi:hypothetical protein
MRTYLTILKRAWSANFKMIWYGNVCPPATFEAGARRPRSSANYNDRASPLNVKRGGPRGEGG